MSDKVEQALLHAERFLGAVPDLVPGSIADEIAFASAQGIITIIRALLRSGESAEDISQRLRQWYQEGAARLDVDASVEKWIETKE